MPYRPGTPCNWPGCPAIVPPRVRFCPRHKTPGERRDDSYRSPAHERGYDARWHKYRKFFLQSHPVCNRCNRAPSDTVDHVVPVTGPDDPLFYLVSNHQALCRNCHADKTKEDLHARPA